MATTSERRKIIKASKYTKSEAQKRAEAQAYAQRQAEEQKRVKSEASFIERYAETSWDIGGKILSGAGKGVEGIVDLLIGGAGLVGGIFSEDFKEGAKHAVEYDVVGNLYGNAIEELTADSYLNDNKVGEIVEQVAEGVGEMLPTVLVAVATGGASAAASGASAASSAATAASAASKAAKVSKIASAATMAAGAAGRGAEEALNDGAELEGAMAYGALSGATEVFTENLTGGVFGKSLNFGNNVAKTGAKRVLRGMAEEASEEMLAEAVSPILKTTYKGADAISEYTNPEYLEGVLQAGLVGGLTSAAYGGSVGRIIHKARGTNADMDSVVDAMSDIDNKKKKIFENEKMSAVTRAARYADMQSDVKENMQTVERVLKKTSPEQRKKLIEAYKLENLFDSDGNLDAEYLAQLDKSIEAGRKGEFSPYVSLDLAANGERLQSDLDAINADPQNFENVSDDATGRELQADSRQSQYNQREIFGEDADNGGLIRSNGAENRNRVRIFDGELTEKGKGYYRDLKRATNNLNAISGRQFNIALVNGDVNFNSVIVGGDNIYINADRVQSGNAIGDLIHELTHFAEGSREYNTLMSLLVSDTDSLRRKVSELTREGNAYGFTPEMVENLSRMVSESGTEAIRYSRMNDKKFADNVAEIETMSDEDAKKNAEQANFVSVMKHTPSVILEHVENVEDLEVIVRFDALYLATRSEGCLKGHYHNLGANIVSKLPNIISSPDAIIRLQNGRINVLSDLSAEGKKNGVISIELNTVKDINSKYDKYNLVVSAFSAKDNYLKNLISNQAVGLEYKKEDLSQVNPQLYEWLAIINDKTSDKSISHSKENVNRFSENISDKEPQVKYSKNDTSRNVIVIEADSELAKRIESSDKSKYEVIRDYLVDKFYGQTFNLSDGRQAIMDKRDAQELSHKADTRKTVELANLKKIVENAEYSHTAENVEHRKFTAFHYYVAKVMYKGAEFELWINVGVAKNDGKNHIYEIVNKKDEAPTNNGVSRPVGNAIPNASSEDIIHQNSENVNNNSENISDKKPQVQYSKKSFSEQVDDVLNGKDTSNTHLRIMNTPNILQKAGLPELPILMTAKHLKTITAHSGNGNANYHGLDVDIVKKLPQYLSSPVIIADSLTRDDSVVIVTEAVDSKNAPVIAAIMLNGIGRLDGKYIDANIMTSAYGKDNFQSFINRIAESNSVIYWNEKKSQNMSVNLGIQFPNVITSLDSDTIIHQSKAFVNTNSENISETEKLSFSEDFKKSAMKRFGVTKLNDYIHVQQQVRTNLPKSFFSPVTNSQTGMIVNITHKGINETFKDTTYQKLPMSLKIAKLATVDLIPEAIENGDVRIDNQKNYHNEKSVISYAYIYYDTVLENQPCTLKIDVRKSADSGSNRLHVHSIDLINKKTGEGTVAAKNNDVRHNSSPASRLYHNSEKMSRAFEEKNNFSKANVSDGETATGREAELLSEIVAGIAEDSIGMDGAFIDKLVRGNDTLTANILNRIESMTDYLSSRKTPDAREQYKRLKRAEKLFTDALAATGKTYRRGNVIGAVEKEEKREQGTSLNTSIQFSRELSEYPYDMQKIIDGYLDSVNNEILQYATECQEDKNAIYKRIRICDVSQKQVADAKRLLGIDFSEYKNFIERSAINHIEKRHGKKGKADTSMKNLMDLSRVGFVLENYDSVEVTKDADGNEKFSKQFRDSENNPAVLLKYKKKINGSYYAVIACPVAKYKKVWLVSAYIEQRNGSQVTQEFDDNSPNSTPEARLASPMTADNRISQNGEVVKPNLQHSRKTKGEIRGKNIPLQKKDLQTYMQVGKTLHTRNKKQRMLDSGKSPILTDSVEIREYISKIIKGEAQGEIRAFAVVGSALSEAIREKRSNLNMQGKYLELNADDLREAYKNHSSPKEYGDIPLSEKDFENIPEYLNYFDGVLSVDTHNNGTKIHIYKQTDDGYIKVITVASSERSSLQVIKLIGLSKEKFDKKYKNKIERDLANRRGQANASNSSTTTASAKTLSESMIPQNSEVVKPNLQYSRKSVGQKAQERENNLDIRSEKITLNMSDEDRYEILKDRYISLSARARNDKLSAVQDKLKITDNDIEFSKYGDRVRLFKKLGEEFSVFHGYNNGDIRLDFSFSKENMRESVSKQLKGYMSLAKMLTCFNDVIDNAIGIEVHNRNTEKYKADNSLKNVYVLASAFIDGEHVVPVKLEVKEFSDKKNTLHVAMALESIKIDEIVKQEDAKNGVARQYSPSSNISITDYFRKINPSDESFYKYIPKPFVETISKSNNAKLQYSRKSVGQKAQERANNFEEDKYFKSQIAKWESLKHGGYVKIGNLLPNNPLCEVGMPTGILRYDVDKLNKNMGKHYSYLTDALLLKIPEIISNPVAISEYQEENTVSVFGNVFVGNSPMMIGVVISKDRGGNLISKIRTYNARRDVGNLITDDTVLYLDENKKRTREWFQACGIQVPLGGNKFGFIRSISQNGEVVKPNLQYSRGISNWSDLIGINMNEEERAKILRSKTFDDIPNVDDVPQNVIDRISKIKTREEIGVYFEKQKKNIQNKISSEFRVVNGYANTDINLSFETSESVYKGSKEFDSLTKLLSVLDKVVHCSVGVQYERIYNDPALKRIFTMIGAFEDGDSIIPVCFEIKEYMSNEVIVGVSFDNSKKSGVYNGEVSERVIGVPALFKKIAPQSTNITKHIPVRLLTKAQLEKLKQMTFYQTSKKDAKISQYEAEAKRGETVSRKWDEITHTVRMIKDVKKGAYIRASEYQNHVFRSTFEKIDKILWRGPMRQDSKVRVELSRLSEWYSNKQNRLFHDEDGTPNEFYRPDIDGCLKTLSNLNRGDFSIAELNMLIHVLSYIKEGIRYHNEMWRGDKWCNARVHGQKKLVIMQEAKSVQTGMSRLIIGKYARQFADNASIYRAADGYDENGFFTENFTALRDGLVNMATENYNLFEKYDAFLEDKSNKGYIKRLTEEKIEYRGSTLTIGKFISLYMTSKRKQSWAALVKMGFCVYDDKDRIDFSRLADNANDVKIADWEDVLEQCSPYIESMQAEMEQKLTERDRRYIEIVEEIYEKCSVMKEATDNIRFGISNIISDYYYPIERYDVARKVGIYAEINTTLNMPFNKDTILSAGKLLIESVDTVLKRHAEGVLLYSNFAVWADNFNKVLNVELGDDAWKNATLRGEIDKTSIYRDVLNHLMKLEKDITTGKILDDPDVQKIFSFLRSSYAKAQLGINLKVLPTQLSSYLAAGSILDYNCIARAFTVKGILKEVDKYCSLAKVRYSDNTAVKAQTVTDKVGKVGDALLTPIGWVDRRVIAGLFGACQIQVQKDMGLRLGTHENKVEAGKLLEKVILETQQNSLLTERSAAMRSNNEFIKALVMFTADANKIMGRVLDGLGEVSVRKRKLKLFKANPNKNVAEIARLEKERAGIVEDLGVNKKITVGMSDGERAKILRRATITPVQIKLSEKFDVDIEQLEKNRKSAVEKSLIKKLQELGFLKEYSTASVDVKFELTGSGIRKSMNSQVSNYGGNLLDFSKVIINIQALLDNAVLLEIHSDKAKGTQKENPRLLKTYVLLSAFRENNGITPVQFEIKHYVDDNNRLYLAVALTKIETGVMGDTALNERERTRLLPISNISIPHLIEKINPKDKNFFKYIPDELLSKKQLDAKNEALEIEARKYGIENKKVGEDTVNAKNSNVRHNSLPTNGLYRNPEEMSRGFKGKDGANVNSISENNQSELEERLAYVDERLEYLRNERKYLERDLKNAERKLYRSVSALVSTSIYMAVLSLAFKAFYGKLKDKEREEIAVDTVFDFFGNMLGGLPIYSDVYSFITDGYEVDIFALDMFNQLLHACTSSITLAENALSGKTVTTQDVASSVKKVVVSTGMMFGIPARNAYNLTSGLLNTFLPQTGYALNDFFGETSRSADLKRAIENEDEKMIGVITSLMIGEGDTEYTETSEKALNGLLAEGYSVLPRSIGDTVMYNGVSVELDRSQKKKIKSIYSEADKAVNSLTSLAEFKKASSDVQAKAIRFINNLYYQMALGEVLGDSEKSKYELFAVGIDVYRLAIIIALAQSIEADKDAKGNTISGSKKKKVMEFIEAQRLTAAQKHMLAGALGYTNTKGEQKVMSYISTLPLTQQEKSRLLEYSGYKVA